MAWFDANDYFILEMLAQERVHDLGRRPSALERLVHHLFRGAESTRARDRRASQTGGDVRIVSTVRRPGSGDGADRIASFIRADRRRRIDGVIDYFGESPTRALNVRAS